MRLASVNLVKVYMKRVLKELDGRDTAGNEAALVAQSVRFTYRVHQVRHALHDASSSAPSKMAMSPGRLDTMIYML